MDNTEIPINEAYYVFKGEELLGPFTIYNIQQFVKSGLILRRDIAFRADNPDSERSIEFFLKQCGLSIIVEHRGGIASQIKSIGKELIIPATTFTKEPWKNDSRLFILSLVGLTLSVVLAILPILTPFLVFYIVALYFSCIWGLFFHYLFKTSQVKPKIAILIFFVTQLVIFLVWDILSIPSLNPFNRLMESDSMIVSFISCILGVGVTEEFFKVLPIILVLHYSKDIMKPQTMVYYGLISGIAFGVFEGVQYQMGANFQILNEAPLAEGYVITFLLNIARLTCLPFLHAVWCGIASYFCAFAYLYPRYRKSLFLLAVLIPAVLHGIYDFISFAGLSSLITIPIVVISVVLLMVYLSINYSFHSRLAD